MKDWHPPGYAKEYYWRTVSRRRALARGYASKRARLGARHWALWCIDRVLRELR